MFEHEIRAAVTDHSNLVNICTKENINKKFWKNQNLKEFKKSIEYKSKVEAICMDMMPEFDRLVFSYEIKWLKPRHEFSIIEKDEVRKKFHELFGEKYEQRLNAGRYKKC